MPFQFVTNAAYGAHIGFFNLAAALRKAGAALPQCFDSSLRIAGLGENVEGSIVTMADFYVDVQVAQRPWGEDITIGERESHLSLLPCTDLYLIDLIDTTQSHTVGLI